MPKHINLALQGGGAHGAFTWGVLDRLLEDEGVEIAAISATSAGALNAAALKSGLLSGGRDGARATLDAVWAKIGAITDEPFAGWMSMMTPAAPVFAQGLEYSPGFAAFDMMSRFLSPYSYGALFENPLARVLETLDFDAVCSDQGPDLHICATNLRSGKIRVFHGAEIGPKAILASACLPTLFKAVEIEDPETGQTEAYWDGGYTGNPALFPLFAPDLPDDILVVNINPLHRDTIPRDPQAIQNRINEISFNTSLLRELRAIDFVQRLIDQGSVAKGQMKRVLVHMIADDALMTQLNVATKTMPNPVVLARLKESGRAACHTFLDQDRENLGQRSSVDLRAMFS